MVKQGDIIKINFNPQKGHEQSGYRPAVVVEKIPSDILEQIINVVFSEIEQINKSVPELC